MPIHGIKGAELAGLVGVFGGYGNLRPRETPPVVSTEAVEPVEHLRIETLFACMGSDSCKPPIITKVLFNLQKHISREHGILPRDQRENIHWRELNGQTLYSEKKYLHYFEVTASAKAVENNSGATRVAEENELPSEIQDFVDQLHEGRLAEARRREQEDTVVEAFDRHKSEARPWLQKTGIATHIGGLPMGRVGLSYSISGGGAVRLNPWMEPLLKATDEMLYEIHASTRPGPNLSITVLGSMCTYEGGLRHRFRHEKEKPSLKRYFGFWKQLLVYVDRFVFADDAEEVISFWYPEDEVVPDGVVIPHFTPSEACLDAYHAIMKLYKDMKDADQADLICEIKKLLPWFFFDLVCANLGRNVFASPLVSYAAMLAVKPSTQSWKEANDYSPCLSGLIWVCQLLVLHWCIIKYDESMEELIEGDKPPSLNKIVNMVFDDVGRHDSDSPLGQLLNWREEAKSESGSTVMVREALWNLDQTSLRYDGINLGLSEIPRIIASEYKLAEAFLLNDLLMGGADVPWVTASMFTDNFRHRKPGQSLLDVCREVVPKQSLVTAISKSMNNRKLYMMKHEDGVVRWNPKGIELYEIITQKFLGSLLVLVHMSAGQPLRSSEILSTKLENTQSQVRSVFVFHERVMIRVNYHKGLQMTGNAKDNIRFLPVAIGELLLNYMVYVMPLRREFLRQAQPGASLSPFLWANMSGTLDDKYVSRYMKKACARVEAPPLTVQPWRQITVAIVKAKFASQVHCFDLGSDVNEENRKGDEGEADLRAMHRQRNHTTFTANHSYANKLSFGGISDEFFQRSYRASQLWAGLFDLDNCFEGCSKRVRTQTDGDEDQQEDPLSKRIRASEVRKFTKYTNSQLLEYARQIFKSPGFQWMSTEQGICVELAASGTEAVICVLPTGGGKSLVFMLLCLLEEARTTVVVVPLISLRSDMMRRFKDLKIQAQIWEKGQYPTSKVVVVSAEAACTTEFITYCQTLISSQRLDRIVVDECHLTLTQSGYRRSMSKLGCIRTLHTRFVYLTATLPPAIEPDFRRQNFLRAAKIVRASADRSEMIYARMFDRRKDGCTFLESAGRIVMKLTTNLQGPGSGDKWNMVQDRVIVYCLSIAEAEELGAVLQCGVYSSKSGSAEEKDEIIRTWLHSDSQNPYLVATSALSVGFDYAHVRLVIHVDVPRSPIDFVQEVGRAGRDGEWAVSYVIAPSKARDQEETSMQKYMNTTGCLRQFLSILIDSPECRVGVCNRPSRLCDSCGTARRQHRNIEVLEEESEEEDEIVFTGDAEIRARAKEDEQMLSRFEADISVLKDTCVACRLGGRDFDHLFNDCSRRTLFLQTKKKLGNDWVDKFTCCYRCFMPQTVCQSGFDAESSQGQKCQFRDLVMPFCFHLLQEDPRWVRSVWVETESRGFKADDTVGYMRWLGKSVGFGSMVTTKAVALMARRLTEFPIV